MDSFYSKTMTYHFYNQSSHKIWNILSDVTQTHYLLFLKKVSMFSEPIFLIDNNSKEVGSIFHFTLLSSLDIYIQVQKVIETDYWCYLEWKAYHSLLSEPLFLIKISVHTINAMNEESCMVINEFGQYIDYKFYFREINSKFNLFHCLDNIVSTNDQFKIQIGSIGIKCPFLRMIRPLLDWKRLQHHVPIICDKVDYEDEELKKGTVIRMQFFKRKSNMKQTTDFIILKVKSISIRDDVFVLCLESVYQSEGIPSQEIEYTLWKINKDRSYYVIKHIFKEVIPIHYLDSYKKKKIQILKKIKSYCEDNYAWDRLIDIE